jgi:hypothetical protein
MSSEKYQLVLIFRLMPQRLLRRKQKILISAYFSLDAEKTCLTAVRINTDKLSYVSPKFSAYTIYPRNY